MGIWELPIRQIYDEVDKDGNKLDETYYNGNIPEVRLRIEMAGIRLAGVFNDVFK